MSLREQQTYTRSPSSHQSYSDFPASRSHLVVFGRVPPEYVLMDIREKTGLPSDAQMKIVSDFIHIDSVCSDVRAIFSEAGIMDLSSDTRVVIVLPYLTISAAALVALTASFCPSKEIWIVHWRQSVNQTIALSLQCLLQQF